jgi:serine protease Do
MHTEPIHAARTETKMNTRTNLRRVSPRSPAKHFAGLFVVLAILIGFPSLGSARTAPESFADLADRLLPAVVNISTTQVIEGQPGVEIPQLPEGSPFEEFFREFFERNQQPQTRRRATSLGSGFIIDPDGYIVTNNHVIQDADEVTVILQDETRLEAEVIGRDPKTDVAILKVEPPTPLPALTFGDSDAVRVGDWIMAIGNPFGFGGSVTAGIISARGRDINAGPYDNFLQTDASINRGNSGGPMFNLDGEVIGINTAIFSPSGGNVGIGFAIPSNGAQAVVNQLIEFGEVRRGWLGVRIQQVTDDIAETLGLPEAKGALVASVIADGPADDAEIKAGDVILEFDEKPIPEMRRLPRVVAETNVGKSVPVKVWRDGRERVLNVAVGALKEGEEQLAQAEEPSENGTASTFEIEPLGMSVSGLSDALREQYELRDETKGIVITAIDVEGPAAEKNIRVGDIIVEVSGDEIESPDQLATAVEKAIAAEQKSVLLLIEGGGGLRFVAVRIEKG